MAIFSMASATASVALLDAAGQAMGSAPAAIIFSPSLKMASASTVAVVVPSPATSLVLVAASLTSWAPRFSCWSSSSISSATVTPSLVTFGAPQPLSSTALRPRGPSVRRHGPGQLAHAGGQRLPGLVVKDHLFCHSGFLLSGSTAAPHLAADCDWPRIIASGVPRPAQWDATGCERKSYMQFSVAVFSRDESRLRPEVPIWQRPGRRRFRRDPIEYSLGGDE